MEEVKQLEMLSESIQNEIDDLQSMLENSDDALVKSKKKSFQTQLKSTVSNLDKYNDSIYTVFEELNSKNMNKLQTDYEVLHEELKERLTHEEKVYMKLKYNIDFWV